MMVATGRRISFFQEVGLNYLRSSRECHTHTPSGSTKRTQKQANKEHMNLGGKSEGNGCEIKEGGM